MNTNSLKYLRKNIIKKNKKYLNSKVRFQAIINSDLELKNAILIIKSGLFDYQWYLNSYSDIADLNYNIIEAAKHYNKLGWKENRNPGEIFHTSSFLARNENLTFNYGPLVYFIKNTRKFKERILRSLYNDRGNTYENWIETNENIDQSQVIKNIESFKFNPKISIVIPVYNPDPELLVLCIESIINQSYTNWQLCLADDCSTNVKIKEIFNKYENLYKNINVVFRETNGHISAASNSALNIAKGEWVALVDHDDELPINALYHVVSEINTNSNVEFIYSDEDKITEKGERYEPHFKPNFNLDLLYSQNYISHLGVYKTEILKEIGGFRLGVEGSQDYDLLLRYLDKINFKNVSHIPKVLYHWRAIPGSTALGAGEKSYTTDAGIKALKDYFLNKNEVVDVTKGKAENIYRVKWTITEEPLVSLIIPTYNGYEITKNAIDSILNKTTYKNYEIILVDNNSNEKQSLDYFDQISNNSKVTVIKYPKPFNYSAINNFAVKQANGEIIGLINNDVEVISPEWLTEMVSQAIREDIGCVGAMLYYPNNKIQHAGVILGIGGVANHSHYGFERGHPGYFRRLEVVSNITAVTAACLVVRKDVYNQVNGLNEENLKVAFNDVDFCLKVDEAGYRNLWTPYAELYHHESITRGQEDSPEKKRRFESEVNYMLNNWGEKINRDPYYSPNLTLLKEDFSIK